MASKLPPGTCKPYYLGLAVTSTGAIFIVEIKMPDPNRANIWTDSAKAVYDRALTGWVCMEKAPGGGYHARFPEEDLGEPEWPTQSFSELLLTAYRGHIIDTDSHPVFALVKGRKIA